ncbi:Eukaryotic translation initiation factor eIF-1 [Rhizoclosmatium sp. JEL0117]|nr:Eukaryotic translation initiation factor eIF-1 [Rhizoclosmatium sp. JEL0117]
MVRELVRRSELDLKGRLVWVANNNVEQAFVEWKIGAKFPKPIRVLRPVGLAEDYEYPSDLPNPSIDHFASRTHDTTHIFEEIRDKHKIPLTIFPFGHKYGGPKNLLRFKGFIDIPYQYSVMKFYENIAYGVPQFVPTPQFYEKLVNTKHHFTHCIKVPDLLHFPTLDELEKTKPNSQTIGIIRDFPEWSGYMDYYDPLFAPYVYYFNSWEELREIAGRERIKDVDWKRVRESGPAFYNAYRKSILDGWKDVFVNEFGFTPEEMQRLFTSSASSGLTHLTRSASFSAIHSLRVCRTASISHHQASPISMTRQFSTPSSAPSPKPLNMDAIVTQKKPSRLSRKAALTLTPAAVARLRELYSDDPSTPKLLKVGTRKKGCSGQTYSLEYVSPSTLSKLDEIVEQDGVKVLIDSKALFSLIGSEMDFTQDELSSTFVFNNPNVKEMCGCGQSFMQSLIAKDPFADLGDDNELEVQQGYIHVRIQQRNGRKTLTTVQGIPYEIDPKKVLKAFKKQFACNGNIIEDEEHGECIQLQGDQRAKVLQFLTEQEISTKEKVKIHGF